MDSKASAVWKGDLRGGSGTISAASGVLSDAAYTFATRFEGSAGTNPEELVAAAHAGWVKSPLASRSMPLIRAHFARFSNVRRLLVPWA